MVDPSAPPVPGAATTAGGRAVVLPDGWTISVTDKIVSTVDTVRSKTTAPITLIARALVYGLLIVTAGTAATVVLVALTIRGLVLLFDLVPLLGDKPGRSVWIVDLVLGLGLLALGSLVMAKGRIPKSEPDPS